MKILIVDDEPAISDTLAYALRSDGFTAESCMLGAEAIARLGRGGPTKHGIALRYARGIGLDLDGDGDSWLNLTRYEYLLLALLLERPGRILSRNQIMESVWQDGGESLERTVDTHIKTLRGKLRAVQADDDSILTHRGLGSSIVG